MLYVGPSTRAVLEPRSLRAGFTLSETPAANGEKTKGTWGLGVPKVWRAAVRESQVREASKGFGEWMESAKVGEIGVKNTDWM